jgi:hypothetical protein
VRRTRLPRRACLQLSGILLSGILLCTSVTASATAQPSVRLSAKLSPERLGKGTTIGLSFQITTSGEPPPALTAIAMSYPSDLPFALSGLGVATCSQAMLEASGPAGCPAGARIGSGTAIAELPSGPGMLKEPADVTIVRAPEALGHLALLFYIDGSNPVDAQLLFPGLLLPAAAPINGSLTIAPPLIPSLPGAPDVALVAMSTAIGPRHLTYYEHRHGKLIAYHPQGIPLPNRCPRGGFHFAAEFGFQDGSHAHAHATVACP